MPRDQLGLRGDDVRMRFDDLVSDRLVVLAPLAAEQRLVGGILNQRMAEKQSLVRHATYHHELGRKKLAQCVVERRATECDDFRQQTAVEFSADDGGDLRNLLRGSRQPVEARHERALKAVRNFDIFVRVRSALKDRSSQLFDEK